MAAFYTLGSHELHLFVFKWGEGGQGCFCVFVLDSREYLFRITYHPTTCLRKSLFCFFQALLWWRLRLLVVHQQLLEEKSEQIFKAAQALISEIDNSINESEKSTLHYVHYLVEIAGFYFRYYDINKATECLDQVKVQFVGIWRKHSLRDDFCSAYMQHHTCLIILEYH